MTRALYPRPANVPIFALPVALPVALPDWDDAPNTTFDAAPFALADAPTDATGAADMARPLETSSSNDDFADEMVPTPRVIVPESYVRMRSRALDDAWPLDAVKFLDAMGEHQLNLTMAVLCLESSVEGVPYDRSARAAADTLRTRIQELSDLRDALNEVYMESNDSRAARHLVTDAPLTAYVEGLYLWTAGVAAALNDLATGLMTLNPDWLRLREKLGESSHWYFDGLMADIRRELAKSDATDLAERVEEVFFAASILHLGLDKKFG